MILLYTTHASAEAAGRCVDILLEERLIACANIFPVESAYWWAGGITKEGEYVAVLKSADHCRDALEKRLLEIHPYETPCFLSIAVVANEAYEAWVNDQVSGSR
jgi:periplasmic divalent cation tolerance protein